MADLYAPAQPPSPFGQPPPGPPRSLAITSLVLGIVAIAGCLFPVLNIGSVVLALVGLGIGIPALVLARRGTHGGKGFAVAGIILSAVAIVVAVVVNLLVGALIGASGNVVDQAIEDAAQEAEDGYTSVPPEEAAEAQASALAIGETATVGDYTVAVTAVDPDAGEEIAAASEFNEPATGQYVLVDLAVTYEGSEEGDPWIDLSSDYLGADARNYSESTCTASTGADGFDVPTLRTGGTATYSVCFDVPAEAVAGGAVSLEALLSFTGERVVWSAG